MEPSRALQNKNKIFTSTDKVQKDFKLFTIYNKGSDVDEYYWVKECMNYWQDNQHIVKIIPKPKIFPELIDEIIWHQEAPVWSSAVFGFHALFKEISSQNIKVILEGHGVDEMMGGYPYMVRAALTDYSNNKDIPLMWNASHCLNEITHSTQLQKRSSAYQIFLNELDIYKSLKNKIKKTKLQNSVLAGDQSSDTMINPEIVDLFQNKKINANRGFLKDELYQAFSDTILPIVLRVFDRASMAYGIESRAPFMDYRIVQYFFSLPEKNIINKQTKQLLRKAAVKWIPDSVINRKQKMGFSIAETDFFNSKEVYQYLYDTFNSQSALNSDLIISKNVLTEIDQSIKNGFTWEGTRKIWEALNLFLWQQKFIDRF